jgi:hypothetical protein
MHFISEHSACRVHRDAVSERSLQQFATTLSMLRTVNQRGMQAAESGLSRGS